MPAMSWVYRLLFPMREPLAEQDAGGGEAQQRLIGCIRYEMLLAVQYCARINALMPLFKGWVPEAAGADSKDNGADGHGLH